MYGFKKPLTKESILQYISEWDIFCAYIKALVSPDTSFESELREDDSKASCRVTLLEGGLRYKDFGKNETAMDCFAYAKQYFIHNNLPIVSFMDVLEQIRFDFNLTEIENYQKGRIPTQNMMVRNITDPVFNSNQSIQKARQPYIITIKKRNWTLDDKGYWYDRYGITREWLDKATVYPISHYRLQSFDGEDSPIVTAKEQTYSYDYYWHKGIFRRKLYKPLSPDPAKKWISNVDSTIVQGWDLLPKTGGNVLIITSSYKDVGCIMCNTAYHAIAPNNEHAFIPDAVFDKLKQRWQHIILWYNNDFTKELNPGKLSSLKYSRIYDIPYILTPDGTEKDPSDFRHTYGEKAFITLTNSLITKTLTQQKWHYSEIS